MAYGNNAQEYRKNAVLGASPAQLVVMLYDGALRFIEGGRLAMHAHDLSRQNESLVKAQRIVSELLGTLDYDQGGEIAKNLASLYGFVNDRLMQANLKDDEKMLDEAVRTLSELREAWVQVAATSTAPAARPVGREVLLAA